MRRRSNVSREEQRREILRRHGKQWFDRQPDLSCRAMAGRFVWLLLFLVLLFAGLVLIMIR